MSSLSLSLSIVYTHFQVESVSLAFTVLLVPRSQSHVMEDTTVKESVTSTTQDLVTQAIIAQMGLGHQDQQMEFWEISVHPDIIVL